MGTTPLRDLPYTLIDGVRVLSDQGLSYADGAELQLVPILESTGDLSSLSHDLEMRATGWAQTYHLTKSRANLVRSLGITDEMSVLEIGAGCGGVTRWLGERAGLVDALEPMPDRARANHLRNRDLDNVAVFAGGIEDVPQEATYDVVAIVGVLEYVGGGASDYGPYLDFLRAAANVLAPGGTLILAIENKLGVKYLAGSPEDHYGVPFVGVEGYRMSGPARTFSRPELGEMLSAAGLSRQRFLQAFPDYKLTQALLSDEVLESDDSAVRSLAWRIPKLPSPDRGVQRPNGVDEAALWRQLVDADVGAAFGNSFVVLATRPEAEDRLWGPDVLAAYYSTQRRPPFCAETRVLRSDDGVRFVRTPLQQQPEVTELDLKWVGSSADMVDGPLLIDLLADRDPSETAGLLEVWVAVVARALEAADGEWVPIDATPANIVVTAQGEPRTIDQEWFVRAWAGEEILARGLLLTAIELSKRTSPSRWQGASLGSIALELGSHLGLPEDGEWLARAVWREGALQAQVARHSPMSDKFEDARKRLTDGYVALMGSSLSSPIRGSDR